MFNVVHPTQTLHLIPNIGDSTGSSPCAFPITAWRAFTTDEHRSGWGYGEVSEVGEKQAGGQRDAILTGGYSSRLFQEIREKRGLCYNIGALSASYRSGGFWAIEAGVAPDAAESRR